MIGHYALAFVFFNVPYDVLNIVLWITYVVVHSEIVAVGKLVYPLKTSIFLQATQFSSKNRINIIILHQLVWNPVIVVKAYEHLVTLSMKLLNNSHHPLKPSWERGHRHDDWTVGIVLLPNPLVNNIYSILDVLPHVGVFNRFQKVFQVLFQENPVSFPHYPSFGVLFGICYGIGVEPIDVYLVFNVDIGLNAIEQLVLMYQVLNIYHSHFQLQ